MPPIKPPKALAPYLSLGLDLDWKDGDTNAVGDCLWCGRENKFSVSIEEGLYRCFHAGCDSNGDGNGGSPYDFVRRFWQLCEENTNTSGYASLADERGYMYPDTLMNWGMVKSVLTDRWLMPGYAANGTIHTLYRYIGKKLIPTTGLGHHMFMPLQYDKNKYTVFLCEGPWDAMALWELLYEVKEQSDGAIVETGNREGSLGADCNVLAVPGCNSVQLSRWAPMFSGKKVFLMFDNDHPVKSSKGKTLPGAGYAGMKKSTEQLTEMDDPPEQVYYLHWGTGGFTKSLASGTDLRDLLCNLAVLA